MSSKHLVRIAIVAALLAVGARAWLNARAKQQRQDLVLALSLSVGADLVQTNNSQALTGVTPALQADIKRIQASPTQAVIEPGDDAPPLGDGSAVARLMLTNTAGQALTIRLRPASQPGTGLRKYMVIGYRKTETGAAKPASPHP